MARVGRQYLVKPLSQVAVPQTPGDVAHPVPVVRQQVRMEVGLSLGVTVVLAILLSYRVSTAFDTSGDHTMSSNRMLIYLFLGPILIACAGVLTFELLKASHRWTKLDVDRRSFPLKAVVNSMPANSVSITPDEIARRGYPKGIDVETDPNDDSEAGRRVINPVDRSAMVLETQAG